MKFLDRFTVALTDIGAIFIVAMMLLTIADIVMKNVLGRPIAGTFELVELALASAVFLGLPDVFRKDANIVVDVLDHMLSPARVLVLKLFGTFVTLLFLLLLGWATIAPALDTVRFPQYTQEVEVPLIAYWIPILGGIALTIVCTVLVLVKELRRLRSGDQIR